MKFNITPLLISAAAVIGLLAGTRPATACSTCYAPLPTLCDTIEPAQVAVFGRLINAKPGVAEKCEFRIDHVLKGRDLLGDATTATAVYFTLEDQSPDASFLILGNQFDDGVRWSPPIEVTTHSKKYIARMLQFPKKGVERLEFALPYLDDPENLLWNDAHDEFAKSPYKTIRKLKPLLDADDLAQRLRAITDPLEKRINLYWTLLGICAGEDQVPFMEERLSQAEATNCNDLNALIACYLTVVKEKGLPLIEREFLTSEDVDHLPLSNAAIAALRFHGEESDALDRQHIVDTMVRMLQRPQLGRNVVGDLARWEIWSALDQVSAMFERAADVENPDWIREPVAQYLLVCPLPEAQQYIERFEQVEPDIFQRKRRELAAQLAQAQPQPNLAVAGAPPDGDATDSQVAQAQAPANRDGPPNQPSPPIGTRLDWWLAAVALLGIVVVVLTVIVASKRRGGAARE